MEVILKQDISKLGVAGSIIKVKDGFARNFLLPNHLALPCTTANLQRLTEEKKRKLLVSQKAKQSAEELAGRLSALSLTMPVLVQEDKLYGSIGPADILEALKEEGFEIDREMLMLEEPIKSLGIYEVPIKLHPEVSAKVKIWVVKK